MESSSNHHSSSSSSLVPMFLPSLQYSGSKAGYYYRNDSFGLGYYRDDTTTATATMTATTTTTTSSTNNDDASNNNNNNRKQKRPRMTVRINENENMTVTIQGRYDSSTNNNNNTNTNNNTNNRNQVDDNNNNNHHDDDDDDNNNKGERGEDDEEQVEQVNEMNLLLDELERRKQQEGGDEKIVLDLTSKYVVANATKQLQKYIQFNNEQRCSAEGNNNKNHPIQYMDSEILLYEIIDAMKSFSVNPIVFYHQLRDVLINDLLPLLYNHPNTDIQYTILSLFIEWFDPSLLVVIDGTNYDDDNSNDNNNDSDAIFLQTSQAIVSLVSIFLQNDGLEYIINQCLVLSEQEEEEEQEQPFEDTNDDDDTTTNSTTNNTNEKKQWYNDVLTLIENILEIESIIQTKYPILSINSNNNNNNSDKNNNDNSNLSKSPLQLIPPPPSSSSSSSYYSYTSVAGKLMHDTHLLYWLFQQLDLYIQYQTHNKNQNRNEDDDDGDDSNAIVIRANRCLEILVLLSSKEDIYPIINDWSHIQLFHQQHHHHHPNNNGQQQQQQQQRMDAITIIPDNNDHDNHKNNNNNKNNKNKTDNENNSTSNRSIDGMELLLFIVAQYKKRQPYDDNELEQLENAALIISYILMYSVSSATIYYFVNTLQGIELIIRCFKEQVHAGGILLKWLDLMSSKKNNNNNNNPNVNRYAYEYFINHANGLKYIFTMFRKKHLPIQYTTKTTASTTTNSNLSIKKKKKKEYNRLKEKKEWYNMIESTIVRILYNLTIYIQDNSPNDAKQRLLTKFIEEQQQTMASTITTTTNDDDMDDDNNTNRTDGKNKDKNKNNKKCDRLIQLLLKYEKKTRIAEYKFFRSDVEDTLVSMMVVEEGSENSIVQLAVIDAKLKHGGLDVYHRICAMIAYCCIHSKQYYQYVIEQLHNNHIGINLIRDTIQEFISLLSSDDDNDDDTNNNNNNNNNNTDNDDDTNNNNNKGNHSNQKEQLQKYLDLLI